MVIMVQQSKILSKLCNWWRSRICFKCPSNNHNVRMYAPANQPPECHYNATSSRQKLTVWVELCGNGDMLGPFFFDENVNRQSYINLFNKVIPSITLLFQNQFYENQFQRLWWSQDGGPLPWVIGNSLKTKTTFWGKSLISLHNNKERSPRPPDLTPCNFFSLGLFKRKGF